MLNNNYLQNIIRYIYNDKSKKKKILFGLFVLFIIYKFLECSIGVPIINIPMAMKKISKATFVYADKSESEYTCYYYVLFKDRRLYTFCGNTNYSVGSDILSENYLSKILKGRSKYISKSDYEKILNWGYEANFYSHNDPLPEIKKRKTVLLQYRNNTFSFLSNLRYD